jgi:hypothetical protein
VINRQSTGKEENMSRKRDSRTDSRRFRAGLLILAAAVILLGHLGNTTAPQTSLQRPTANLQITNLVGLDTAKAVAWAKAAEVAGTNISMGEPILCSNGHSEINAYMFVFRVGTPIFPTDEEILYTVQKGIAYEEALDRGETPEELKALIDPNEIYSRLADMKTSIFRSGGQSTGIYQRIEREEIRKRALKMRFGIDDYLTIYVSASYENFPIRRYKKSLPIYYTAYEKARDEAGKALGSQSILLAKYYFLGMRGEYFEFTNSERTVIYDAVKNKMIADEERLLRPKLASLRPAMSGQELILITDAVRQEWQNAIAKTVGQKPGKGGL